MASAAETLTPVSDISDISFDDKENKEMGGGDRRLEEAASQNSLEEEGGAQGKPQERGSHDDHDHDRNVSLEEVDYEDSDEEFDVGFIRVRRHGIFGPDDEDDDDNEFDEFPSLSEIELTASPQSKKRKQEISFRNNGSAEELIVIQDVDENEFQSPKEPSYTLDPDLFGTRRRDRMPLYLLNPNDYAHEPQKQLQIRRAILTYRHHQDKKEQIIKLTEENRLLRAHIEDLQKKVEELARCDCVKNRLVSLEILDVKIPVVPPRMYVRGSKFMLGVPYNRCNLSPTTPAATTHSSFSNAKTKLVDESSHDDGGYSSSTTLSPPLSKPVATDVQKPLINIGTSILNLITSSSTLKSVNSGVKPVAISPCSIIGSIQVTRTNFNGSPSTPLTASGSVSQRPFSQRFLQPGVTNAQIRGENNRPGLGAASTFTSTPTSIPATANVKVKGATPATASTASKLVFGSKQAGGTGSASGTHTVSQLLFGAKLGQARNIVAPNVKVEPSSTTTLTASQLAMANNRVQQNMAGVQLWSSGPSQQSSAAGQVFRTSSGQMLRLVQQQPPTNRRQPTGPIRATKKGVTPVRPIFPRPGPAARDNSPYKMPKRPFGRKDVEELWKRLDVDDDDEDELAILAAINGIPPPLKMARKHDTSFANNEPGEPFGRELLSKYCDIVFEEAE